MGQYANDLLADGGWRSAYKYYQGKWDLMPMFIPSEWKEIGMEDAAGTTLSIQMNRDIWVYRLTLHAAALAGVNQGGDMTVQLPLYFEYRISINGQPVGGWVDAYLREGGWNKVGLGAGFHIPQAKSITVDIRRTVALVEGADGFEDFRIQIVAEGCELFPKDSHFYDDGMRNQILEDWEREAELKPMWYGQTDWLDLTTIGNRVTLQQETDASPFLLNRIHFFQYPDSPVEDFQPPVYWIPFDAEVYVDNQPIFDHVSAVACTGYGGYPLYENHLMRVPLLITPRSRLFAMVGGWPWVLQKSVKVGVIWGGHKIIAR